MLLHPKQKEIVQSNARFKVIRAGRRSGKSSVEIEILIFKAVSAKNRKVVYIAPTQKQAREIIWEALKQRLNTIGTFNEQRLDVRVPTKEGGTSLISVSGWENRENFRGQPAHHITFDETDTLKDFFIGWNDIFRPALIDTQGTADFIGTPKKENPNLRRLEKEAQQQAAWDCFHFTSHDNPHLKRDELIAAKQQMDATSYRQEIMAEYVENEGALFHYSALIDLFSNSVVKGQNYLTVDIADDGSDQSVCTYWHGLEAYRIDRYSHENTDGIINLIREGAAQDKVPYSHIAVDAIGVGAGVASSPLLAGIIGFKSSYGALRTEKDIVRLPNVHYLDHAPLVSEYKNLRSQCVFTLAGLVNDHLMAVSVDDARIKSHIIEELATYQDISTGDGKRMATQKEDVRAIIGRSPDISDTLIMRMYFTLKEKLQPHTSEEQAKVIDRMTNQFARNQDRMAYNSAK